MEREDQYELHLLPCVNTPPHRLHSPQYQIPLRIHICSPLSALEKLLPHVVWDISFSKQGNLQPGADALARLVYRNFYNRELDSANDAIPRAEGLGLKNPDMPPDDVIYHGPNKDMDYYEMTFDHWVPIEDEDPEVLTIFICETEYEEAGHANRIYRGTVDPKDYAPYRKRLPAILGFLGCCTTNPRPAYIRDLTNRDVKEHAIRKREWQEVIARWGPVKYKDKN